MNYPKVDHMVNMSEFYTGMYTQPAQQGPTKPRRRRKKNKGDQSSEGVMRKRKLSEEQVNFLEIHFGNEHKLESERKDKLALELGLDPRQVAVWFQNRRARWKSQKMEEEYIKLKADHESTIIEKCRLETEVLKLKEQLSDAEKEISEIQKQFERYNGVSSNSPGSSFSMEAMSPQFFGDFGIEGIGNVFYLPENYTNQGIDWVDLYM